MYLGVFLVLSALLFAKLYSLRPTTTRREQNSYDLIQNTIRDENERLEELVEEFLEQNEHQSKEINEILENSTITEIEKFEISKNNYGWVVNVIRNDFNKITYPRTHYLITDSLIADLNGQLAPECTLDSVDFVRETYPKIDNFILQWSCSTLIQTSLFNIVTGKKVFLSDPKGLIPTGNSWAINEDGDASGVFGTVLGDPPVFIVNYGHAQPSGVGVFNLVSGDLQDLILF